jgi:fructose/tagatose bisphosphate aldolase
MMGRPIIVHSLAEARAAVAAAAELGVPVTLASAPEAAGYLGALWFRELVRMASEERPEVRVDAVLDCGDQPGHVMAALRQGLKRVRFTGPKSTAATLRNLASQYDAEIVTGALRAHDMADQAEPETACRRWLTGA